MILQWSLADESFWRAPSMATVYDIAKSIAVMAWKDADLGPNKEFSGNCNSSWRRARRGQVEAKRRGNALTGYKLPMESFSWKSSPL